jgi:hypothetical protein
MVSRGLLLSVSLRCSASCGWDSPDIDSSCGCVVSSREYYPLSCLIERLGDCSHVQEPYSIKAKGKVVFVTGRGGP